MSQKARTQETRLDCSLLVRSLPVDCHSPCVHYRPGDDSAAVAAYARFRSLREPLLLQRALTNHQVCPLPSLFHSCCAKPSTQSLT
jgi:hypothetical protein